MTVLVTGAAGFIGYHVATALLSRGDRVVGVDNLNDYYEVSLKEARLARLDGLPGFAFRRADVADRDAMAALFAERPDIDRVVHLAAQAGVRYSLVNPYVYLTSNIEGHVVLLEQARRLPRLVHFVYASSSSVYGANRKMPFSVSDRTDRPVSLYGATKKAMEVISDSYASMYGLPLTGLRFFTVYGPWGRPDMAAFLFTRAILAGQPIPVFNQGDMRRDFTFIDDIVSGVIAALDRPPSRDPAGGGALHRLYNLGNHQPEQLLEFIATLEAALGRKAVIDLLPMQPGDVKETYADIEDWASSPPPRSPTASRASSPGTGSTTGCEGGARPARWRPAQSYRASSAGPYALPMTWRRIFNVGVICSFSMVNGSRATANFRTFSVTDRLLFTSSTATPSALVRAGSPASRARSAGLPAAAAHEASQSARGTSRATRCGRRSPQTMAWATSGRSVSSPSIRAGDRLSPPELTIRSFLRSVMTMSPSASISPMSPVCSQPSRMASRVASSFRQ
jgi:UDP-glucuronate 4-epimerase